VIGGIASPRIELQAAQIAKVQEIKRDTEDDPVPSWWDIFYRALVGPHIFFSCL
jgi:hypothetical protein